VNGRYGLSDSGFGAAMDDYASAFSGKGFGDGKTNPGS